MEIKINLTISADSNLLAALQALAGGAGKATPVIPATENGEVKKSRKAKEEKTEGDNAPATITIPGAVIEAKTEVISQHTLDSVRAMAVPRSKAGHRAAIKEKITELGYESLEDMQPTHFNEFVTFLNTIPLPQS